MSYNVIMLPARCSSPQLLANEGLVQPANERPVCCTSGIWITPAVGRVRNLAYLAFACQMRWFGEVFIIITLDWEKHIRDVKLCMTFESGPECILTHFWAIYDLVLIQWAQLLGCKIFQNKTIHRKFTYGRSGEERNIYSYYNEKAYINILKYFHSLT
jgi:hypothetical protein